MPWRHESHVFQLQLQIGSKKLGTSASKELCHLVSRVVNAFLGGELGYQTLWCKGILTARMQNAMQFYMIVAKCYVERSEIHASELAIWMLSQSKTFQFVVVRGDICKCECSSQSETGSYWIFDTFHHRSSTFETTVDASCMLWSTIFMVLPMERIKHNKTNCQSTRSLKFSIVSRSQRSIM